jgi:hypothetical protein
MRKVNPSTPRPEGQGLPSARDFGVSSVERSGRGLRVDPERRFLTPPSKAGLGAVEWVNREFKMAAG